MLTLQKSRGQYHYSIFSHPLPRVLKFERFSALLENLPKKGRVLDYGAGDRPLEPLLKTHFDHYTAADYPPANAAHARLPDIEIDRQGHLNLPDRSFQCVVLTEVLEHIYQPLDTLKELHRLLQPGGALIGTVPFAIQEHEQPYDYHRYTSFCLRRMFEDAGFEVEALEYVGDGVATGITGMTKIFLVTSKALYKLGFPRIAQWNTRFFRLPEIIYYYLLKGGLNPGRVRYYAASPLGFVFLVFRRKEA